jgi:hypothetical protein
VRIVRRSSAAVVLASIDVPNLGWSKALQPQLGIQGNVAANQDWWMEFEMKFLKAGTNNKKKISNFNVTALDVDGDGAYIQEYVQMNKVKASSFSPVTYLVQDGSILASILSLLSDMSGYNLTGTDKKTLGPKQNFVNIDTSATSVMTTYNYEDKDVISFVLGAKSSGGSSTAGERMNSLWFKSFNLGSPTGISLPVKLTSFNALLDQKNVTLSWTSATEENFSHYVIEKSTDGKNFSDMAIVFGGGSSASSFSYQYKDKNVASASGIIYYRLRLVDQSKEESYSDIKLIRLEKQAESIQLTTYPNPVHDQLRLTLPNTWQGKQVMLEFFTSNGTRIQNKQIANASQTETLIMNSVPAGFYLVKASCDGQVAQQRIIKN